MESLTNLVQSGDEAELLIAVDRLSAAREWENLETLAERCRDAQETTGKQLWPIADHIDYRLALEAPAAYAASVLAPGAGRFALGPLTEVAASVHPWAALEPHLDDAVVAAVVAAERTLRGEDLTADAPPGDLPHRLASFEPTYALPRYRDRTAEFAGPGVATAPVRPLPLPSAPPTAFSDDAAEALTAVVEPWATQSNGTTSACAVEGSGPDAIAALTRGREAAVRGAAISAAEGLALLQWAGASGGAHGRRRGGASGRFNAWWAAAVVAGLEWPGTAANFPGFTEELDAAMAELRWWRWEPTDAASGWELRIAVEDPVDGLSWAVEGTDAA